MEKRKIGIEKKSIMLVCCMLVLCLFGLGLYEHNKAKRLPIEEYNNDVFTKELYEKVTKIAIDKQPKLIHIKEDTQSIHDAFALLASLKLSDFVSTEELYGSIGFRLYIRGKIKPVYVVFGNNNVSFGKQCYAYDKEIQAELVEILTRDE